MKKVAVVQSNYIPWKGYFDLINSVDEFILFDEVQYTRRDWRNRNLIKTPRGLAWLTIPVAAKGHFHQKICDTQVSERGWGAKHWSSLARNYANAPHFELYRDVFEPLYRRDEPFLSVVNHAFLSAICGILGIATRISWSMDYTPLKEGKTERLVDLCRQAGASEYLSGPMARDYIDPALFDAAGIGLSFFDYAGYPEYPQSFGKFEHGVTILDLLFNLGPQAPRYMKSFA